MKRVRDASKTLLAEGILILGHQGTNPEVIRSRGFPAPKKGEIIALLST